MKLDDLSDQDLENIANGNLDGLSDEALAMVAGSEGMIQQKEKTAKDSLLQGADYLGRGLDYAGGLTRTAAAKMTGTYQEGDLGKALEGHAPSTADLMQRGGWDNSEPVLPEALRSKYFDPTVRDTAGFVGDVALDPLTYLSGGLSAVAKKGTSSQLLKKLMIANERGLMGAGKVMNAAVNPVETLARSRSTKNYAKAFKEVDKEFSNPESIGSILHGENFVGSGEDATKVVGKLNSQAGDEIGAVLKEAAQKGAKVDLDQAFPGAQEYVKQLRQYGSPEASQLADQIEGRIKGLSDNYAQYDEVVTPATEGHYPGMGTPEKVTKTRIGSKAPVDVANEEKAFINNMIKSSGFAQGDEAALATQARKAVSGDLADSIKGSVKSADEELYNRLTKANDRYRSTNGDVQERLQSVANQVKNTRGPLGITKVDAMLASFGLMGGGASGGASFAPLAIKKSADALQSIEGRTARGRLNKSIGNSKGVIDAAARQALWIDMLREEEKNK
jgi:hypothetical protein